MDPTDTMKIASRFRGPPHSGNGGYVCGCIGAPLGGVATVRLMAPPPLDTGLQIVSDAEGARLLHDDRVLAQARRSALDLPVPPAPSLPEAIEASKAFAGFDSHPFPGCFVCGPERADGDGLRIFPGHVAGRDLVAAPWTPAPNLADARGRIRAEFMWSALDCTGFFAFGPLPDGAPALLGELTARIEHAAIAGEPHVVSGWSIGAEGRKRYAGSAIHAADGRLLASARATWIVLTPGAAGAAHART
jgi:hypothetical protein